MSWKINDRGGRRAVLIRGLVLAAPVLLQMAGVAVAEPVVTKTTWREIDAYKLSDGRAEAVVVPKLGGRVMVFRLAGGSNFIWSGEPGTETRPVTQTWGGEKTYIGPHTMWKFGNGSIAPTAWRTCIFSCSSFVIPISLEKVLRFGRLNYATPCRPT